MLTARAGAAVGVDLQVLRVDVHLDGVHLRQHGHGGGAGVDAAAGLRLRHALDAVHPAFKLQAGVRPLPADEQARLAHAAELRLVEVRDLGLPAVRVGVHGIHSIETMRKERRFFPTDTGAQLQNDIAVIVRVARQQQHAQRLLELRAAGLAALELFARDLVQFGIAEQCLRLRDLRLTVGIGAVCLHDRLQLALLAAESGKHRWIGIIRGVSQLALELTIPVFNLLQLFEHTAASLVAIFAQCISVAHRRENVNRRCAKAHRLLPVEKPKWFSDKRSAVCCAHNLCASSAQIPHLQPEKYFLRRTCRRRK